jgi:hypothetical protein
MTRGFKTLGGIAQHFALLTVRCARCIAQHFALLTVRCARCERRGRLRIDHLLKEYGPDIPMPDLRQRLAQNCPKREAAIYERCDVFFPEIGAN